MFFQFFAAVTAIFAVVDGLLTADQYLPQWLATAIFLRLFIALIGAVCLALHYIPKTKFFMSKRYNSILFWVLIFTGIVYALFIPMYADRISPGYGGHTIIVILICVSVRSHWEHQVLAASLMALLHLIAGVASGYLLFSAIFASAFVVCFVMIGYIAIFAIETDLRSVFKQQQYSVFVLNQHASVLEELAKKAEAASEAKSRFVANISHEIRTPLHGVITALDLLKNTGLSREQESYIEAAETSSGLLLDIINNVLTMSKLQANMVSLNHAPIDLRSIVEGVTIVFSQIAGRKGVEVISYFPPACPVHLISDDVHIKQILFNLVSNAVKFTSKGYVSVCAFLESETPQNATISIKVQDSGTGIAPQNLHLLFQRFSQVDESRTRNFQGTGLGLAIVHEFSKLFGGQISVHSDGIGHGTSFTFTATFQKDLSRPNIHLPHESTSLRRALFPDFGAPVLFFLHPNETCSSIWISYFSFYGIHNIFHCSRPEHFSSALHSHLLATSQRIGGGDRVTPIVGVGIGGFDDRSGVFGTSGSGVKSKSPMRSIFLVIDQPTILRDDAWIENLKSSFEVMAKERVSVALVFLEDQFSQFQTQSFAPLINTTTRDPSPADRPFSPSFLEQAARERGLVSAQSFRVSKPCRSEKILEVVKNLETHFLSAPRARDHSQRVPPSTLSLPRSADSNHGSQSSSVINDLTGDELPQSRLLSDFIVDQPKSPSSASRSRNSTPMMVTNTPPLVAQNEAYLQVPIMTLPSRPESGMSSRSSLMSNPAIEILLAEDNLINRNLTERLLKSSGFHCTSVENGQLAVNEAERTQFAVIFMDISMPEMDGCTATRLIRQRQKENGVPRSLICALSAAITNNEDENEFSSCDFDFILPKPVKSTILIETARQLSELYQKQLSRRPSLDSIV